MTNRTNGAAVFGAVAIFAAAMGGSALPAQALTSQQCSAKYQAAKTAGMLSGQTWNAFRKAECNSDATATPAASPAPAPTTTEAKPAAEQKPAAAPAAPATAAVFPSTVDSKYAKETAARARLHTCADQWKLNKASNATGGLRWIQKGGGYWSECNKKLKGA